MQEGRRRAQRVSWTPSRASELLAKFGQLAEPEVSGPSRRVRHPEVALVRGLMFEAHDVEVQGARSPTKLALSPSRPLDALQLGEELSRREIGLDRDHLVEVQALSHSAQRGG